MASEGPDTSPSTTVRSYLVMKAESEVREAFEIDVRPLLEYFREEAGLPADPMSEYLKCGYENEKLKRGHGGKGWE